MASLRSNRLADVLELGALSVEELLEPRYVITHLGKHDIHDDVEYDSDCPICVDQVIEQFWIQRHPEP